MAGRTVPAPRPALPPAPAPVAVGYARCSTDLQERSVSDQVTAIARWCEAQRVPLARTFTDEAVSGGKLDRPGLAALFAFIEQTPGGGTVVMWHRNRLARADDARDGMALERRIESAGWTLRFLQGSTPTGNRLADMLVSTVEHHEAGQYRRDLAVSTLRGAAGVMAEGGARRGSAPYGYATEVTFAGGAAHVFPRQTRGRRSTGAERVRLVPGDPREVEAVRFMFDAYAAGRFGLDALAAELIRRDFPPPTAARWSTPGVRCILRNPAYVGDLVWNRRTEGNVAGLRDGQPALHDRRGCRENAPEEWVVVRDHHEALVDRETFERAQRVREARAAVHGGARHVVRYALSGLMRCEACGGLFAMRSQPSRSAGRGREYRFICNGPDPLRPCRSNSILQEVIEAAVRRALAESLSPLRENARLRAKVLDRLSALAGGAPVVDVAREERDLEGKIARAVDNLAEVDGPAAKRLAARIAEWEARLAEMRAAVPPRATPLGETDPAHAIDEALEVLSHLDKIDEADQAARRTFYESVIERVVVRHETRQVGARTRHIPVGGEVALLPSVGALVRCLTDSACPCGARRGRR